MTTFPRIAITAGEPAGVGPELVAQLAQFSLQQPVELVVVADPHLLEQRAQQLKLDLKLVEFDPHRFQASAPRQLSIQPVSMPVPAQAGQLDARNANYVLTTLGEAAQLCLQRVCAAVCTAPVHKGVINQAGINFSGHTEFFAQLAGIDKVVMQLQTEYSFDSISQRPLRVALVTTHLPLKDVPRAITAQNVEQTLNIVYRHLEQDCVLESPCIMVAGLNPHAGEDGHLGSEEQEIINPVLQACRDKGWDVRGCLPADTMFTPPYMAQADAFVAMYHDQGLGVLKHIGFHRAANVTLGLPFIRTSVDHGTALDLAGTGQADVNSFRTALDVALSMLGQ